MAPIHALIIGVFGAWAAWELINTATKPPPARMSVPSEPRSE